MKIFLKIVAVLIGLVVIFGGLRGLAIVAVLIVGLIALVMAFGGAALALKSLKDLIE